MKPRLIVFIRSVLVWKGKRVPSMAREMQGEHLVQLVWKGVLVKETLPIPEFTTTKHNVAKS